VSRHLTFIGEVLNVPYRFYARVHTVYPPKYSYDVAARDANKPDAEGMDNGNARPIDHEEPHQIYGDLKIAVKDINSRDDPFMYYYWVHLTELERDKGDKGKSSKAADGSEMIGSLMEVQCGRMRYSSTCSYNPLVANISLVVTVSHFPNPSSVVSFVIVLIVMLQWHHRGSSSPPLLTNTA
jgi:hypothetical protein